MSEGIELSEEQLKNDICKVMRHLFERGLVSALGGNVSARLPGSNEFWITPSGIFKGELTPDDLIKVDLDGNIIEGFGRPSIETPLHAAIYRVRPDVNAIVHAHNPFTLGLALAGVGLKPITVEAVMVLRKVEVVPFAFPGTDQLAKLVAEKASTGARALILQNHGIVALGSNLYDAEAVAETLEEVATAQFVAMALGKEPPVIPEREVELYYKLYRLG
ncbi:class II aldolase/adducin family protein [Ignisphaera sp. 4213-co]|uniref:Class II aldolase/adducin family protein n=1 Tax=Ignisphaera cupida TaxID=3050454 RepID=A0ABD4Z9K7_9CREN|nr:class II aldolase/adducin family protein [Ignisphaera sp. 4213-co]MDK6029389.1 class II aldolase/adducin family protein [Ignisphaera sp. 4213-co]